MKYGNPLYLSLSLGYLRPFIYFINNVHISIFLIIKLSIVQVYASLHVSYYHLVSSTIIYYNSVSSIIFYYHLL